MLTWHITRGSGEGTLFEVGGKRRVFRFTSMDRDTAEQTGDLAHGDWLMDGKWLAFHQKRGSFGVAFGERYWLWQREQREASLRDQCSSKVHRPAEEESPFTA